MQYHTSVIQNSTYLGLNTQSSTSSVSANLDSDDQLIELEPIDYPSDIPFNFDVTAPSDHHRLNQSTGIYLTHLITDTGMADSQVNTYSTSYELSGKDTCDSDNFESSDNSVECGWSPNCAESESHESKLEDCDEQLSSSTDLSDISEQGNDLRQIL